MNDQHLGKVIDIKAFREKQAEQQALVRGRVPLYESHIKGDKVSTHDFALRISKLRQSIEKINALVADLKKRHSRDHTRKTDD